MAPHQSHGFIGNEINTWIDANRRTYKELFEEAEKLNADCYQSLSTTKVNNDNMRQTIIACLFPRCMELFQATYILVARGMSPSANIMLRSLMETMFILCAAAKNDDALNAYVLNDELERLKITNKMLSHKETFAEVPLDAVEKIKVELDKKIKDQKIKKFSTEDFAIKAGLHGWYLTAYAVTSRAVHATVRDMEQYLVIDEKENIRAIRFSPTDKDATTVLSVACNSLSISLEQFLTVFGADTAICGEHAKKVKALMEQV